MASTSPPPSTSTGARPASRSAGRSSPYDELRGRIREQNIIVAVLAVPPDAAQQVADDVVDAGVKIIFNYTEALLDVPHDVTVHTTSPAVELLYALYFYLT
jgi:redox-sensing transcriptional repressor